MLMSMSGRDNEMCGGSELGKMLGVLKTREKTNGTGAQ